jgi:4a-hydroxytetrahydrobiopterin dehydratase
MDLKWMSCAKQLTEISRSKSDFIGYRNLLKLSVLFGISNVLSVFCSKINWAMTTWKEENQVLIKTFTFASFEAAMQFMQKAAPLISETDHHPTWSNTYNRVEVRLTTHDAGNCITQKDRELAKVLDEVYSKV